ncbi:hypothetical protein ACWED2_07195 [Amycolatopsis sp. NPDC005003]
MAATLLPVGGGLVDAAPPEATDRPRADSPRELPAQAEREYLREHIVLGYN